MIRMRSVYKSPATANVSYADYITEHISVTLDDGTVLTGDAPKVWETVKKLQPVPMYQSSSKGSIPIVTMATQHIKNALLHQIDALVHEFRNVSGETLAKELERPFSSNKELSNLIAEYIKRIKAETR